ncbi:LapA family protein [Acuticoccus sp. M5D2P5]|uniref:lipopolysaccharide assembly protein LapA domain-containing protein n=1 Tax=Acuticoccus kalidii TaxID=2910977 RepID=UPI001F429A2C|nr:LapA family protein [Acuticoccus kalidii]MCF3935563.1 LapA family protein [Acuticoccus kalidii]
MRYLYLALIIIFVVLIVIFALQNFTSVTVAFLGLRFTLPLALLVVVAYVLGAITGGSLYGFLRYSYSKSKVVH